MNFKLLVSLTSHGSMCIATFKSLGGSTCLLPPVGVTTWCIVLKPAEHLRAIIDLWFWLESAVSVPEASCRLNREDRPGGNQHYKQATVLLHEVNKDLSNTFLLLFSLVKRAPGIL